MSMIKVFLGFASWVLAAFVIAIGVKYSIGGIYAVLMAFGVIALFVLELYFIDDD